MLCIKKVEDLIAIARRRPEPATIVCAAPENSETLESLRMAIDHGIARPIAVGRKKAIMTLADTLGISLEGFEFHDVPEQDEAARVATRMVRDGYASILMKGSLPTKTMLRAVLDHSTGLRSGRMLSHIALFDAPPLGKPVIVTDASVNIRPNLSQKIEIVKNAAEVMRRLGVKRPNVALIAAIEYVDLPAMPATLDAKLIERMAEAGELGDVAVQGPLALDDAVSIDVVRAKELTGPVAGKADILVVPEIETGNVLYKALTCFAGIEPAGMICGVRAPLAFAARGDTARVKLLSIALAAATLEA